MYNLEKQITTLELDRVLNFLCEEATMPEAKEKILTIKPSCDFERVKLLLKETEEPIIRCATTYVIEGEISEEEFAAIKKHC